MHSDAISYDTDIVGALHLLFIAIALWLCRPSRPIEFLLVHQCKLAEMIVVCLQSYEELFDTRCKLRNNGKITEVLQMHERPRKSSKDHVEATINDV